MSQTDKNIQDTTLAVTLTVEQLRALVREEVERANHGGEATLLTADELAQRLNVPISWVYEQSRQGNIPTHRIGRYVRFDFHEVLASRNKE